MDCKLEFTKQMLISTQCSLGCYCEDYDSGLIIIDATISYFQPRQALGRVEIMSRICSSTTPSLVKNTFPLIVDG